MIEQILQADRYLQVDQVERAREVYGKVVDLDPGNAIAVVGLARCALADGDDARAYELASRALEIDPENDMARRMEARLSEILATRGEPVGRPDAAATPSPEQMRPVVTEPPRQARSVSPNPATLQAQSHPAASAASSAQSNPAATTTASAQSIRSARSTPPTRSTLSGQSAPPAPAKPKEPAVRKSFFDRILGR